MGMKLLGLQMAMGQNWIPNKYKKSFANDVRIILFGYPLVMTVTLCELENGPVEIVSFLS